jgi:hypothetical protein
MIRVAGVDVSRFCHVTIVPNGGRFEGALVVEQRPTPAGGDPALLTSRRNADGMIRNGCVWKRCRVSIADFRGQQAENHCAPVGVGCGTRSETRWRPNGAVF